MHTQKINTKKMFHVFTKIKPKIKFAHLKDFDGIFEPYSNTIYISNNLTTKNKIITIAHETLHYITNWLGLCAYKTLGNIIDFCNFLIEKPNLITLIKARFGLKSVFKKSKKEYQYLIKVKFLQNQIKKTLEQYKIKTLNLNDLEIKDYLEYELNNIFPNWKQKFEKFITNPKNVRTLKRVMKHLNHYYALYNENPNLLESHAHNHIFSFVYENFEKFFSLTYCYFSSNLSYCAPQYNENTIKILEKYGNKKVEGKSLIVDYVFLGFLDKFENDKVENLEGLRLILLHEISHIILDMLFDFIDLYYYNNRKFKILTETIVWIFAIKILQLLNIRVEDYAYLQTIMLKSLRTYWKNSFYLVEHLYMDLSTKIKSLNAYGFNHKGFLGFSIKTQKNKKGCDI